MTRYRDTTLSSTAGMFLGRRAGLADVVSLRGRGGGDSGVAPSMVATDAGVRTSSAKVALVFIATVLE